MSTLKPFGEVLRGIRERHELMPSQVADRAGLDRSHISRLEAGKRRPERVTVGLLADGLGADPMERRRLYHAAGFVADGADDHPAVDALAALMDDPGIADWVKHEIGIRVNELTKPKVWARVTRIDGT